MREFHRDRCLVFIPYIDLIIPAISLIDSTLSAHVSSSIVYSSFAQVGDMAGWLNVETGRSDLYESSRIPIAHHPEHSAGPRRASVQYTYVRYDSCAKAGKRVQAALSALPGSSGFFMSSKHLI